MSSFACPLAITASNDSLGTESKLKKPKTKAPKIQRLITPKMLQHKRRKIALKKNRLQRKLEQEAEYAKLHAQRAKEDKEKKDEAARKRRSTRESQSSADSGPAKRPKTVGKETPAAKTAPAKEATTLSATKGKHTGPDSKAKGKFTDAEATAKISSAATKGKSAGPDTTTKGKSAGTDSKAKLVPPKKGGKKK